MYDRDGAHESTLRNPLQRRGYDSLEEVRADGKLEGKAEAVIAVLTARGLQPSADQRVRVLACSDVGQIDRWLTLAVTSSSLDDMFPS
jgi:hypothetical protein